jgi:hypothetical protein
VDHEKLVGGWWLVVSGNTIDRAARHAADRRPWRAQGAELKDARGVIQEVNAKNGWYAIVPDGDRDTRYAPDRLPDEFK